MGRVRNTWVRRNVEKIMDRFGDEFTKDFEKNKEILKEKTKTYSKKVRNRMAGYITKIKKEGIILKKVE